MSNNQNTQRNPFFFLLPENLQSREKILYFLNYLHEFVCFVEQKDENEESCAKNWKIEDKKQFGEGILRDLVNRHYDVSYSRSNQIANFWLFNET